MPMPRLYKRLGQFSLAGALGQISQQLPPESAGVFRIGVDTALKQGFPQDGAAAHGTAVFNAQAVTLRIEPQHLRQDDGLGEILRADAYRLVGGHGGPAAEAGNAENPKPSIRDFMEARLAAVRDGR